MNAVGYHKKALNGGRESTAGTLLTPSGYLHVSDASILANRINQFEQVISRIVTRLDNVEAYRDLLEDFKDPHPVYQQLSGDARPLKRQRFDESPSEPIPDVEKLFEPPLPVISAPSTAQASEPWAGLMAEFAPPAFPLPLVDEQEEIRRSRAPSHHEHDAALTLESLALGHGYSMVRDEDDTPGESSQGDQLKDRFNHAEHAIVVDAEEKDSATNQSDHFISTWTPVAVDADRSVCHGVLCECIAGGNADMEFRE